MGPTKGDTFNFTPALLKYTTTTLLPHIHSTAFFHTPPYERRSSRRAAEMESQDLTPAHHTSDSSSRPSLGFPLGTALLLIIIFSLSGFFSCCYHWEKLRSLRRSFSGQQPEPDHDSSDDPESIPSPSKPTSPYHNLKQKQIESLPVIMPGDNIPKFMALPCPCEPPRPEKITIQVQSVPVMQTSQQQPLSSPSLPPPDIVYSHVARFGVYYDG